MAQVKIYGLKESIQERRETLSKVIHQSIVESLALPKEKKFHRFILLEREDFIFPEDKSDDYTIIEIMLISGRTEQTKKRLIHALFENIERDLSISKKDIEICIIESFASNWGFRGVCGDEIALNYTNRLAC